MLSRKGSYMFRRLLVLLTTAGVAAAFLTPGSAVGKSIGGCPESSSGKWELVTVESLGIPPEAATGIASLDGNGDGLTCIKPQGTGGVFRDNTV
jgi:hypothetical protein